MMVITNTTNMDVEGMTAISHGLAMITVDMTIKTDIKPNLVLASRVVIDTDLVGLSVLQTASKDHMMDFVQTVTDMNLMTLTICQVIGSNHVMIPREATSHAIPREATSHAIPREATSHAIPREATSHAIPREATSHSIPREATSHAIPREATSQAWIVVTIKTSIIHYHKALTTAQIINVMMMIMSMVQIVINLLVQDIINPVSTGPKQVPQCQVLLNNQLMPGYSRDLEH